MRSFRTKLLVAMALVVVVLTTLGLYLAQRKVAIEAEGALRQDFGNALATWHRVQEVRRAALAQRSRELAQRARIHAALEDGALDLLYPSAKDELRDIVAPADAEAPGGRLRARTPEGGEQIVADVGQQGLDGQQLLANRDRGLTC